MAAYGPVTNHLATSASIPCTASQAGFNSCVQGMRPQTDVFYASSFPQVTAVHNLMQNKLLVCAQAEPEIQNAGSAFVGGVSFLTGILAIVAAAAAGHRLNRKLSYERQSAINWTVSGLALFQQWLQEKLVAICTPALPDEEQAVDEIKPEKPREILMPKPIRDSARLISLHEHIMNKGWQPYMDIYFSPSDKFTALRHFVQGEEFDDIPGIEVVRHPDDAEVDSVSADNGSPFIRLICEDDYIDFEPAKLGNLEEQRRLLDAYDEQLHLLRKNSLYQEFDMTQACFASLLIWLLLDESMDVDEGDPFLSDDTIAAQSQELMNQNPKFFDSVLWKDMPKHKSI